MKIVLNNRETEFPAESASVQDLLQKLHFTFPMIIVRINGRLIQKEEYGEAMIAAGDRIDCIHLISGG